MTATETIYRQRLDHCEREADRASVALRESHELTRREHHLNDLISGCVEGYREFRLWEADTEREWENNLDLYSEDTHRGIKELHAGWDSLFIRVHQTLRANAGLRVEHEPKFLKILRKILDVLQMDLDEPLPEHLATLAVQAMQDLRAGDIGEMNP